MMTGYAQGFFFKEHVTKRCVHACTMYVVYAIPVCTLIKTNLGHTHESQVIRIVVKLFEQMFLSSR